MRQGENIAPFLFPLYLNDLEFCLQMYDVLGLSCIYKEIENVMNIYIKLFAFFYADDTVLFAESVESHQSLETL